MKRQLLIDGLHQYSMHLYQYQLNSGLSEDEAKTEVTKILLQEIKYFSNQNVKFNLDGNLMSLLNKVLGRELTEDERFRLIESVQKN